MLYSTCTFAPAEDEQTVSHLLENRPDMELAEMEDYEGFSHGVPEWGNKNPELIKCIRISHTNERRGTLPCALP